jgi:hypothetical protein
MPVIFKGHRRGYRNSDLDLLRKQIEDIFDGIFPDKTGKNLFGEWLRTLTGIFDRLLLDKSDENHLGLVIFSARKAWGHHNLMRPFIIQYYERRGVDFRQRIESKITHDAMLSIWFRAQEPIPIELKAMLIDDAYVLGNSISNIAHRLCYDFGVPEKNITVYALAIENRHEYTEKHFSEDGGKWFLNTNPVDRRPSIRLNWLLNNKPMFYKGEYMKHFSKALVEAVAISSVPYLSFSCSFTFSLKSAKRLFGNIIKDTGEHIKQEDLKGTFADSDKYEFHNITTASYYESNVESFILFPKEKSGLLFSYLPSMKDEKGKETVIKALRVYVNRNHNLGSLMVQPYVHIRELAESTTADIIEVFPKIPNILKFIYPPGGLPTKDDRAAAWRLLSYATNYIWGKDCIKKIFRKKIPFRFVKCHLFSTVSMRNLNSPAQYLRYLNKKSSKNDLESVFESLKNEFCSEIHDQSKLFESDEFASHFYSTFDKLFPEPETGKTPRSFQQRTSAFFSERLLKTGEGGGRYSARVPLKLFVDKLLDRYSCVPLSHNRIFSAIFSSIDSSQAKMDFEIAEDNRVISFLVPGEQSCHAIYFSDPSYAYFLQWLKDEGKFSRIAKEDIKNVESHFGKIGIRQDESDLLIEKLENMQVLSENPNAVFCAEPHQRRVDISYPFFNGFRSKLKSK